MSERNLTQLLGDWRLILDRWVALGIVAQVLFFARFAVQWRQSERAPVFNAGQLAGLAVYSRNLMFLYRAR